MMTTDQTSTRTWFKKATVRNMDCIKLWDDFDWRFPIEMKPLLAHPLVKRLPQSTYRFLCIQSFYKYLHDVCLTETDVVNRVSLSIAYNASALPFPPEMAAEAFAVIIDEGFHSYVARLFSLEIERVTSVKPLRLPKENQLVRAAQLAKTGTNEQESVIADLLCCCISESTFTKEILEASKLPGYDKTFHLVMSEHLRDEGRHYSYFRDVLKYFWENSTETQKHIAATLLPGILLTYFGNEIDADFDEYLLHTCGMEASVANEVIKEIHGPSPINAEFPRLKNSIEFLQLAGVLADARVASNLREKGLLA